VGLPGTIRTAGLFNLLLAAAIVWLLRRDQHGGLGSLEARPRNAGAVTVARLFLLAAFVTGFASFIYEIAWIRMLSLVLGSATHSFELMLSAFIGGLAIGGLWIRRRIDTVSDPVRFAAFVQLAMGVLAVVSIPVYGESFSWMAQMVRQLPPTDTGYALFTIGSHSIAMAIMLPTTVLAGMTLPLFTHVMLKQGSGEAAIGQVYAANTIGAIGGVLFALHLGLPLLGLEHLLGAGAMLDVCLGIALLSFSSGLRKLKVILVCSSLAIGTIALVLSYAEVGPKLLASGVFRYGQPSLPEDSMVTFLRHGKTATVSVAEYTGGYLVIATNGKPDASIRISPLGSLGVDEGTMLLLAAVPLAYMPDARRVANIGFGSGLTAHTLLADPDVERLDTIEIEPAMVEGARQAYRRVARAYDDPRSHIHFEDAKTFFSISHEPYDVIVSEPSNPWVSGVSSLFSAEFYARVRARLADDGVFAQWVQFYEFNDELVFSILKAFAKNFSDFVVYNVGPNDGLIVGRKSGSLGGPDLESLFHGRLGEELRRGGVLDANNIRNRGIVEKAKLQAWLQASAAPPNSDYYPYVDQHAAEARFKQQIAASFGR
jgi:predicted membrane-bound spermidine synthase